MDDRASRALGVFDSGVGGLTVVDALRRLMPAESIVYLGDTARVPYGSKSPDTIRRFATEDSQFLLNRDVKTLVVACNTATAHALEHLRRTFSIPVIGVIEPGVEATLSTGKCEHVGILGTSGTIRSFAYQHAIALRAPRVRVEAVATPLLVPFIEEGWLEHPALKSVLMEYLTPMLKKGVDTLVLGCTHYPLLVPTLKKLVGKKVRLVDSATTCAAYVQRQLAQEGLLRKGRAKGKLEIHLTDYSEQFESLASRFLGSDFGKILKAEL